MGQIMPDAHRNFIIDERQILQILFRVIFFELLHSEPYFGRGSMVQIIITQIRYDSLQRSVF